MDLFSKFILHNGDTFSGLHQQFEEEMPFGQLRDYIGNISLLRHNGLKSPTHKQNTRLNFQFQCKSNHLTFMLDVSPHMLIYNHGAKALPLKNMQEIIIYLLKRLSQRL